MNTTNNVSNVVLFKEGKWIIRDGMINDLFGLLNSEWEYRLLIRSYNY